jgi:CRP-like cAMP-binding protein
MGYVRTYLRQSELFSAGTPSEGVYLIEKGTIAIQMISDEAGSVSQQSGPGALLGLSEVMTGEDHKFKAVALEDCEICFVGRDEFLEFLRQNQVCCLEVVELLSHNLHNVYHQLQSDPRRMRRRHKRASPREKED